MKRFYIIISFLIFMSNICAQCNVNNWGLFTRYARQNLELKSNQQVKGRVIFIGNSITENWSKFHPEFFSSNNYIGRGIGGQTTYQLLLRFRQDVINLFPEIVVINAATNDIAENAGVYNEDYTLGNIKSMVELAKINDIKVILTSTLPAVSFKWNTRIQDAPKKIEVLNMRLKKYAKENNIPYVNYYARMIQNSNKALLPQYTNDGVHPTLEGYYVMEDIIKPIINHVLDE